MTTALGIDVGTTSTKVALVDVDRAVVLGIAAAPTPAAAHVDALVADLAGRVVAAGPRPEAVGVASMAETGVPVGPDGRTRGDWLRWDGHRADAQARALAERLGRGELFAATGVRASAKVPLATWAWLAEHGQGVLHAGGRWAGAADLVVLGLTGRLVTDHTLAGRTMAYRLGRPGDLPHGFDAALLREVGLGARHVPAVLAPGAHVGLRAGPLTALGLLVGTPVTVAGHDHAVGAFAAGVRGPGDVADSVGTTEVVCTVLPRDPEPGPVAAAGMSLVRTVRGDRPALVAGSSSAGGAVEAWLDQVVGPRGREHDEHPYDEHPHDEPAHDERDRVRAAASVPFVVDEVVDAAVDGAFVVLPYLHGRQTPRPDPAARLRALGPVPADPVAAVRGVLLGAALHARWMLDEQAALAGAAPRAVRVLGRPVATNPAWAAVKRWCTPVPLTVVDEPQAVAAGAALLAAERAGLVGVAPVLAASTPATVPTGPRGPRGAVGPADAEAWLARFVAAATAP
ncbi:carbohydrate kinase [Cellulomonas sp. DKR-3]|uniref:Carbohydrate kinase n=1 Tax=Cellulomonas fulva TaxID=2835530 RepID=A0ABS5TXJ1_9CELL|nr:FGGY family carbohydrate kinase [Cellulomonas fulva]MBT0993816.1 carbohydrate kinase [Cellulomonas fulva]